MTSKKRDDGKRKYTGTSRAAAPSRPAADGATYLAQVDLVSTPEPPAQTYCAPEASSQSYSAPSSDPGCAPM